jgi:hypothetical protein
MNIKHIQTNDRRSRNAFIKFPFELYKNTPHWVPPLRIEMRKIFNPNYSFYKHGEAAFLIAENDQGEVLGRLAMINNHRYNEFHQSKTAFFYYFDVINDHNVAAALFSQGFDWVQKQGLNHVLGPKGFTILDGFGMLIKGFDFQPAFGQPYNPPYYPKFIEALGFTKVTDVLSGRMDRSMHFPEKFLKAAKLVEKRMGFYAPMLKTKAELKSVIDEFKHLYNDSLSSPSGNPPLTDEDMENMASQLLWIADPRLVKLIYKDVEPIGFILAYPDIGSALQRIQGRLFPFGWLQMLIESKRTSWIDFNGIGVMEKYQRLGGTAILYNEMYKSIMDIDQYNYGEFLQFREENIRSLLEASNVDIDFHKTHRLYEKNL